MKRLFLAVVTIILALALVTYLGLRYRARTVTLVPIEEVSDYPSDPSTRSPLYGSYGQRTLELIQKDATHYDFVFHSDDSTVATVAFRNIDLSLLIPTTPEWVRGDPDLEVITLVEREWNRQQVRFTPDSPNIEIQGDSPELVSLELARNCLNAGLFEVLLFDRQGLLYQGWFTFPLGHYKRLFEQANDTSYWRHWHRLEHWVDPAGRPVDLTRLRTVNTESTPTLTYDPKEPLIAAGEQGRKKATVDLKGAKTWQEIWANPEEISFATFAPPGRYDNQNPWPHQLNQIAQLESISLREVETPNGETLDEIELIFRDSQDGDESRFIVGGFSLDELPTLEVEEYPKGLYMPLGIGISPVYETYENLLTQAPYKRPYYGLLIDSRGNWINHHRTGVDGVVLHRDPSDPDIIHLYLLSYERHTLLAHYEIRIPD